MRLNGLRKWFVRRSEVSGSRGRICERKISLFATRPEASECCFKIFNKAKVMGDGAVLRDLYSNIVNYEMLNLCSVAFKRENFRCCLVGRKKSSIFYWTVKGAKKSPTRLSQLSESERTLLEITTDCWLSGFWFVEQFAKKRNFDSMFSLIKIRNFVIPRFSTSSQALSVHCNFFSCKSFQVFLKKNKLVNLNRVGESKK